MTLGQWIKDAINCTKNALLRRGLLITIHVEWSVILPSCLGWGLDLDAIRIFHYHDPWYALGERELRVSPTDNDSYGATQNVERSTKRERDWEEARKGNGAGTSLDQVETMGLALRLRLARNPQVWILLKWAKIRSLSCKNFLPGQAWLLLSKTGSLFSPSR